MRALVGFVLVLALVVGAAGELLLPPLIESRVERQVRANTNDAAVVEADVGDFPFLPALLLEGRIESLDVEVLELAGHDVELGEITASLQGIELDRDVLLEGGLRVTGIDRGRMRVEVVDERIGTATGVVEELGPGAVELRDRVLELAPEGAAAVELPIDERLLPCTPDVEVDGDVIVLTCVIRDVPPILLEVATGWGAAGLWVAQ